MILFTVKLTDNYLIYMRIELKRHFLSRLFLPGMTMKLYISTRRICVWNLSDNIADITHALQKLTEAPPVASLSTAVSSATSRISAMGERSLEEFPIPGNLLGEILKVMFSGVLIQCICWYNVSLWLYFVVKSSTCLILWGLFSYKVS